MHFAGATHSTRVQLHPTQTPTQQRHQSVTHIQVAPMLDGVLLNTTAMLAAGKLVSNVSNELFLLLMLSHR